MSDETNVTETILELIDISAGYDHHTVIQNVNLNLHKQDFLGIIGANGSGKTTLLKVILGLLEPMKGEVIFFKNGLRRKNSIKIGYMPQMPLFDKAFPITSWDVVLSGLCSSTGLFKRFTKKDKSMATAAMDRMGVGEYRKRAIGELSGGQIQRILLARALVANPSLLVLDEPDTYIDKGFENDFYDLLQDLNKEIAIILVSHDLGMISSYVKTIACINRTLYYHDSNELTMEILDSYHCPIDLITHGRLPHRVLRHHPSAHTEGNDSLEKTE